MQALLLVQLGSGHSRQAAAVGEEEVLPHGAAVQAVVDGHLHKGGPDQHVPLGIDKYSLTCTLVPGTESGGQADLAATGANMSQGKRHCSQRRIQQTLVHTVALAPHVLRLVPASVSNWRMMHLEAWELPQQELGLARHRILVVDDAPGVGDLQPTV